MLSCPWVRLTETRVAAEPALAVKEKSLSMGTVTSDEGALTAWPSTVMEPEPSDRLTSTVFASAEAEAVDAC